MHFCRCAVGCGLAPAFRTLKQCGEVRLRAPRGGRMPKPAQPCWQGQVGSAEERPAFLTLCCYFSFPVCRHHWLLIPEDPSLCAVLIASVVFFFSVGLMWDVRSSQTWGQAVVYDVVAWNDAEGCIYRSPRARRRLEKWPRGNLRVGGGWSSSGRDGGSIRMARLLICLIWLHHFEASCSQD